MRVLGDGIGEGDVLLSNHPCAGGSHLPDLTVITPVCQQMLAFLSKKTAFCSNTLFAQLSKHNQHDEMFLTTLHFY